MRSVTYNIDVANRSKINNYILNGNPMRQNVYILSNEHTQCVVDRICETTFINRRFNTSELTAEVLVDMTTGCMSECFYVIDTDKELDLSLFDFSFIPEDWDKKYVHIWGNDKSIRLYNVSEVLAAPEKFTDSELKIGNIELKNISNKKYKCQLYDIVYLSFDESYAENNYSLLKNRFPRIKRIRGVKGIFEAHKAAAGLAKSNMVYVVDADAEILSTFTFDYQPQSLDMESVIVWHSRNPVNDLEYGYGGVKLFPTNLLLDYVGSPIDFTTSVSKSFKVIPEVSNITRFNTDPFSAWRSGFRECAKLSSKLIPKQDNTETEHRLNVWCTVGEDREFGDFAIMGAKEGNEFGRANKDKPEMLGLINDFKWLELKFSS